jgi:DnaK suppressor protein
MSTSLDTQHVPTGGTPARWDRLRALLEGQRDDCVRRREEALAEYAQPIPDPVAQSRSGSLQRTIAEIDAALARIDAGT